jgi:predicted esterase
MEHSIEFNFKSRYFTLGDKESASQTWFVLHGYGQLAKYFIQKFKALASHDVYIVAPEGLSRFYLEDIEKRMSTKNSRVGATWMTRENRLDDIENYLNLLNSIAAVEIKKDSPVTILGFSQGAATASRWALEGKINFKRLVLWAGIFPPDLDFLHGQEILKDKETILVYGKQDPFINDNRFSEMNVLSNKLNVEPTKLEFDGPHDIDEKTLLKLI